MPDRVQIEMLESLAQIARALDSIAKSLRAGSMLIDRLDKIGFTLEDIAMNLRPKEE